MKKVEWPGIATAAAIIFATTVIVAIWRDPDGFKLRDWQTFMAACVALVGGFMAYQGAMAKVDLDRATHQRMVDREEVGIYLRLRSKLSYVRQFASAMSENLKAFRFGPGNQQINVPDLHPRMVFDVDEAWRDLAFFEAPIALEIADIKTNLDALYLALAEFGDAVWTKSDARPAPVEAKQLHELTDRLVKHTTNVIKHLDVAIASF